MTTVTKTNTLKRLTGRTLPASYPQQLERFLWPDGLPEYMPRYKKSPELMALFYVLFNLNYSEEVLNNEPFQSNSTSSAALEERMRLILGADNRKIITYRVTQSFTLTSGEFIPMGELPLYATVSKARRIEVGELVLARIDQKDLAQRGSIELQIITGNLFDSSSDDDHRMFRLTPLDFSKYMAYLKKETLTGV